MRANVRHRHTRPCGRSGVDTRRARPPPREWNESCSAGETVAHFMTRPNTRHLAVAVGAGLMGVALNLAPLPAVARLWPGRVATLPVAIIVGPWYGLLAAVIGAAPLARLAILPIVFAIEALLVGA